jgi:uncharacterized protein YciI
MTYFAVTYVYTSDTDTIVAHREEHRAFLRGLHAAGSLVISGPMPATATEPLGALIVVTAADVAEAGALLDGDPFESLGVIASRTVRQWEPVIGSFGQTV